MIKKPLHYRVDSVVVCDEVRREDNGKHILIGVYNKDIILQSFPSALVQLNFFISLDVDTRKAKAFEFRLVDKDGTVKTIFKAELPDADPELNTILSLRVRPIAFEKETELAIMLGIDREPEQISLIRVRLPRTKEEKDRLAAIRN